MVALPVLAALDVATERLHTSARTWAAATRAALEAISARRVTVEWPSDLVSGLGASMVLRSRTTASSSALSGLGDAHLNWQLILDDDPLSETEVTAVAAAADGLVRLRERWVLIDPATARRASERDLGELTIAQALSAALTGQIAIDGQDVPCTAAGRLADLIGTLRDAGTQDPRPSARCGSGALSPSATWTSPQGVFADLGAGVQIRLGPDDRSYPFTSGQDRWWPAPGATDSPGTAYKAALRARSGRRAGS
jgi:hypothetical protein